VACKRLSRKIPWIFFTATVGDRGDWHCNDADRDPNFNFGVLIRFYCIHIF
jgi:hypothetical protein